MHLLQRSSSSTISLTTFDGNIPPYAILSHRWDSVEPTFQDVQNGTGQNKIGYAKLHFCGKQAAKDGLRYFWVDTVCINKTDSAELTESLNSMYRWYHESNKCYVYMTDVNRLEPDFRMSVWFTRGWTLQELIAPKTVEFFSSGGKMLGDKVSLKREIHSITRIPLEVLSGKPLSDFSVAERISWVEKRETKREEDKAYCLLGIFDIFMPIIYGEGKRAFSRLADEVAKLSSRDDALLALQKVPNNDYNCFEPVKLSSELCAKSHTVASCRRCSFKSYAQPLEPPTRMPDGRILPIEILMQRFHFRGKYGDKGWYRCFICKDDRVLSFEELVGHLSRKQHTYAQICG